MTIISANFHYIYAASILEGMFDRGRTRNMLALSAGGASHLLNVVTCCVVGNMHRNGYKLLVHRIVMNSEVRGHAIIRAQQRLDYHRRFKLLNRQQE
jgi:hypothetical protein